MNELRKASGNYRDRHRVKANAPGNAGDMLTTRDSNGKELANVISKWKEVVRRIIDPHEPTSERV